MALEIIQKPLYSTFNGMPQPVGQQVIFAVRDNTIVATKFNVKFIAEVLEGISIEIKIKRRSQLLASSNLIWLKQF